MNNEQKPKPEKRCHKCGIVQPVENFHKNKTAKDGRHSSCAKCVNAYGCQYAKINRVKHREASRRAMAKMRREKPELILEAAAKYRAKFPLPEHRRKAYHKIHIALRAGKIRRQLCEICGKENAQAHHSSYFPGHELNVNWFCIEHHRAWHNLFQVDDVKD